MVSRHFGAVEVFGRGNGLPLMKQALPTVQLIDDDAAFSHRDRPLAP
jgi:hypothetical protein